MNFKSSNYTILNLAGEFREPLISLNSKTSITEYVINFIELNYSLLRTKDYKVLIQESSITTKIRTTLMNQASFKH